MKGGSRQWSFILCSKPPLELHTKFMTDELVLLNASVQHDERIRFKQYFRASHFVIVHAYYCEKI